MPVKEEEEEEGGDGRRRRRRSLRIDTRDWLIMILWVS
jgi:hypothetical protein